MKITKYPIEKDEIGLCEYVEIDITELDISPDFVDFYGQKIKRPERISRFQWMQMWEIFHKGKYLLEL